MTNLRDLPEDILLEVLSMVPAKDLICNCRLVCLWWRDLVDSALVWKLKHRRKSYDLNKGILDAFYIFCHLEKNLIKNPCGEEGLDFWEIETPSEGEWKVQEVAGLGKMKLKTTDFLWKNSNVESMTQHQVNKCFTAYNGLCVKSQRITLKDHGYWDQLMDESRPVIMVKDWFYCATGCQYRLSVKLLSADFTVLQEYSSKDGYSNRWDTGRWRQVWHTFYDCPPGVRHILFQHQGQNVPEQPFKHRMRITKSSITIVPHSFEDDDDSHEYSHDYYESYFDDSGDEYQNFSVYYCSDNDNDFW